MTKLLHSIDETLEALSIGRTKFYELVADGSLKLIKIGRRSLVSHDELMRYVASLDTKPTTDHDHDPVVAA